MGGWTDDCEHVCSGVSEGLEAGVELSAHRRAGQSSQEEGALIAEHGAEALRAPLLETQQKKRSAKSKQEKTDKKRIKSRTMVAEEVVITLSGGAPWGFRLQGGVEQHKPLQVAKVRRTCGGTKGPALLGGNI